MSEVFEFSVRDFFSRLKLAFRTQCEWASIEAPYFDVNGKQIWGATAMILSELIEAFKQKAPQWITHYIPVMLISLKNLFNVIKGSSPLQYPNFTTGSLYYFGFDLLRM